MSCTTTPGLHNDGCDCPPEGVSLRITIIATGHKEPVYDRLIAIAALTPATPAEAQHAIGKLRAIIPSIDITGVGHLGAQFPRLVVALQWGAARSVLRQLGTGYVPAGELEAAARQLIAELASAAEKEVSGA